MPCATKTATSAATAVGIFGAVDVGPNKYWWDYGQLKLYRRNNILLVNPAGVAEPDALRLFLGLDHASGGGQRGNALPRELAQVDRESIVVGCTVACAPCVIKTSVLSGVTALSIDIESCILINVTASMIKAKRCLLYNVCDDSADGVVETCEGAVRADIFGLKKNDPNAPTGSSDLGCVRTIMRSGFAIDGKQSWSKCVEGNPWTFEDVYNLNKEADVVHAQAVLGDAHRRVASMMRQK